MFLIFTLAVPVTLLSFSIKSLSLSVLILVIEEALGNTFLSKSAIATTLLLIVVGITIFVEFPLYFFNV